MSKPQVVLAFALASALCAQALTGGVFAIQPQNGQMQHIDLTSGSAENLGASLEDQGWSVGTCAPATIEDSLKLYVTLGRQINASSTAPWHLLTISLQDGKLVLSQPLPAAFPPTLKSCDHAVSIHLKGSTDSKAFVSAVVGVNLTVVKMDVVASVGAVGMLREGPEALCSASLTSIGLGQGIDFPRGAFSAIDDVVFHWHVLERGLAGCNITSGTFDEILEVPEGSKFSPLYFNHGCADGGVNGLVKEENGTRIASFDPCHGAPSGLQVVPAVVPDAAKKGTAATVLLRPASQHQIAIQANTSLYTVDLTDGSLLNSVQVCEAESAKGMGCFSSFAYLTPLLEVSV